MGRWCHDTLCCGQFIQFHGLTFLEIVQYILPSPAFVAELLPMVVVTVVATDMEHTVDTVRTAEHATAWPVAAAFHAFARSCRFLSMIAPVDFGMLILYSHEKCRHLIERMNKRTFVLNPHRSDIV